VFIIAFVAVNVCSLSMAIFMLVPSLQSFNERTIDQASQRLRNVEYMSRLLRSEIFPPPGGRGEYICYLVEKEEGRGLPE
jgi:hypothetical protein